MKVSKIKLRNITINTFCILLALGGIVWGVSYLLRYQRYEITNDAYVDQYVVPISVRLPGYIENVFFFEHQFVHEGDTLVVLDDKEYKIRYMDALASLKDAQAALATLNSEAQTKKINIDVQQSNIEEAKARLWQMEQEYKRYEKLLEEESVSRHQFEQVKADYDAAKARYEALVRQEDATKSLYAETNSRFGSAEAQVLKMESEVDLAKLNLEYTVVRAPYDGYMGRRTIEKGEYVQGGQTLTNLVKGNDKWITANYTETQIGNIYIGQPVRIYVDAIPDKTFYGTVTSISEATGSKYSLVPTDNSAGNFVKVRQRIPVRIDLEDISEEDMELLRAGMLVVAEAEKAKKH